MLAVGRLVWIEKTTGDKVISDWTFYNTNYFGYEIEVGLWLRQVLLPGRIVIIKVLSKATPEQHQHCHNDSYTD